MLSHRPGMTGAASALRHHRRGAGLRCPSDLFLIFRNYSCRLTQITSIFTAILFHSEGRFANVTDAGRGAVDAAARLTGDANADGEDVWS
jgi:hypothetical protein